MEKEPNPIDEASKEFAIVAVSTYLFLTKNGLKSIMLLSCYMTQ